MRSFPDTRRSTGYQYENSRRSCLEEGRVRKGRKKKGREGGRKGGGVDREIKTKVLLVEESVPREIDSFHVQKRWNKFPYLRASLGMSEDCGRSPP